MLLLLTSTPIMDAICEFYTNESLCADADKKWIGEYRGIENNEIDLCKSQTRLKFGSK